MLANATPTTMENGCIGLEFIIPITHVILSLDGQEGKSRRMRKATKFQ